MTNDEAPMTKEARKSKLEVSLESRQLIISDFVIGISLVIRASSFVISTGHSSFVLSCGCSRFHRLWLLGLRVAFANPAFDAEFAIDRIRFRETVINIRAQRVQRH